MKTIKDMTFEEALDELKVIFEKMETADLPLEEAVSSYERSVLLKKHCEKKLKDAQMRVDKVVSTNPTLTEEFDPTAE